MLQAERARVLEIRDTGRVAHDVVEEVLGALDVEESMLDLASHRREELRGRLGEDVATVTTRDTCGHLDAAPLEVPGAAIDEPLACAACLAEGTRWVHLRRCLACGVVGCCDSSPRRHATAHFHASGHPVIRSVEPGESWRWCYLDEIVG